jgi:hypothetical protein
MLAHGFLQQPHASQFRNSMPMPSRHFTTHTAAPYSFHSLTQQKHSSNRPCARARARHVTAAPSPAPPVATTVPTSVSRATRRPRKRTPKPIDPKHCHFMLPQELAHKWRAILDQGGHLHLILWHDSSKAAPQRWKLDVVNAWYSSQTCCGLRGRRQPGQRAVGTVRLAVRPPILFVICFCIHERYQGKGYGTAFAKRLNTLLTRRSYRFARSGCTTVALNGVDDAFLFWVKAVGFRHFMRGADAYFGVRDLAGGGLPSEEQLREFWLQVCGHSCDVVDELVEQ